MTQAAHGTLIEQENGDDRRSNERHRVIFRTAKLLLPDHDCFCIMRDFSSTGMKLQVFGPMEGIDIVDIEFLGGRTMRMHKRWSRGDHCGFEFEQPIDTATLIALPDSHHKRRPQRLRINLPAAIDVNGDIRQVHMIDISLAGASIEVQTKLKQGSELRIAIDGFGRKKALVRWWREGFAGVQFLAPIPFNDLAVWSARLPDDEYLP
ncbi:MAG: PilZ domain-containing protein [Novosphingopyxis baekryungensis]|jgi:hypothetical protein|nr:PilZ domain-containing protein [Novosphingopyxis baekryungensis]